MRRKREQEPLLRFPQEAVGRAVEAGLGLVAQNGFSGLWGPGAVLGCPIPGPGVIRAGGYWPGGSEPNKGGGWGVGSGWICLWKRHQRLALPRNLATLGGTVPPESAMPQMSKHRIKDMLHAVTSDKSSYLLEPQFPLLESGAQ